jgi:hypothetical protein
MKRSVVRFQLAPLPHPYPDDPSSSGESWGEITITADSRLLLRWQWDLAAFAKWYLSNCRFLPEEELVILQNGKAFRPFEGESLAQALERLQLQDFPEGLEELEDKWLTQLYRYRQRHSLRFALRGADIPDITIGLNHGEGEISLCERGDKWAYNFDLQASMESLEKDLRVFLPEPSRVRGR